MKSRKTRKKQRSKHVAVHGFLQGGRPNVQHLSAKQAPNVEEIRRFFPILRKIHHEVTVHHDQHLVGG